MDTDTFIVRVKANDIYENITDDVETRFGTWNFELNRPQPKGKNKKVIGVMKDQLDEKTMKTTDGVRTETYSYLVDDGGEKKKNQKLQKIAIKRKLNYEDFKNCSEASQLIK